MLVAEFLTAYRSSTVLLCIGKTGASYLAHLSPPTNNNSSLLMHKHKKWQLWRCQCESSFSLDFLNISSLRCSNQLRSTSLPHLPHVFCTTMTYDSNQQQSVLFFSLKLSQSTLWQKWCRSLLVGIICHCCAKNIGEKEETSTTSPVTTQQGRSVRKVWRNWSCVHERLKEDIWAAQII